MCRTLKAEEIECRVAQVSQNGCSLLLYKTARVDRAILTEIYGNLWQNDFKTIDGKMYGGIGIYDKELKEWLWRWDCGTESNTEAEKGQASDCFKRAGFKWGIGIELYSAPFIFIKTETETYNGKYRLKNKFEKFDVKTIGYDDNRNINKLVIVDSKNNVVFELGKYIKPEPPKPPAKQKEQTDEQLLNDLDIIQGLQATDTIRNLNTYYNKYKDSVSDLDAFQMAYKGQAQAIKQKG